MEIKFKQANIYQSRRGSIFLNLGNNLLFELTEEQAEGFDLYSLEDFDDGEYRNYYDALKQQGVKNGSWNIRSHDWCNEKS